jgi:hypothetical protein
MQGQVRPWRATPGQTLGVRWQALEPEQQYAMLRAYYGSNNLYSAVSEALRTLSPQSWQEALRPLRNPTFRVVESYVATVWPGPLDRALEIETENEAIKAPIQQLWTWSNWASQKQVAIRWLSRDGDLFIKVSTREDAAGRPVRVYLQLIDAAYVTEFDTDERGYLTYLRLDIPQTRREGDETDDWIHTEIWDKATDTYRRWERRKWLGLDLLALGTPTEERPLSSFGIDFLPFVHAQFRDVGEARGQAAIVPVIDKIDESNRQATRLHQMLYRHGNALWALQANQVTPDGRPAPPPTLEGEDDGTLTLGGDQMVRLPGNSTLAPLVPNINYDAALNVLNAQLSELEHDLPELAYSRIRELGAMSGVAIKLLLTDFIDRVTEVRGNAYDALVRANQMALTIGAAAGLFRGLGTYESGALDHRFVGPPVIEEADLETAQARLTKAQAIKAETDAGISLERALLDSGYDQQSVDEMVAEKEKRAAEMMASLAARPAPAFGQGQQTEGA